MKNTKSPRQVTRLGYTSEQAASGTRDRLPAIDTWPNQYRGYEIRIEIPEFTAVCPKTGLPDFGTVIIEYMPERSCLELKSLKDYINSFRNLGVFNENAVNRILRDVVRAARPRWAVVTGRFTARGGMNSTVTSRHRRRTA
ncbi:MAG: NADPH-dependent 7-cyano-7-deazaguanine reductase QueF [Elusimicrobia bacterium GWA2_69_24]|nr:MAG: NADPH-dependent 7-cyano-7-deazaguanine reductase QueF [Elusimicrobia bacterium GWA2_69_24]HBL17869.1 NADPH-dependent 7-cyano-7-deazaguanine reductase QueF [Elusimicrobiota bacterium]